jgi:hypothetical protein
MSEDLELSALKTVYDALKDLDAESQQRVIDYMIRKFGLIDTTSGRRNVDPTPNATVEHFSGGSCDGDEPSDDQDDDTDGISPIAVKWMRRNSLTVAQLGKLFSLGADDIDLVANTVPGKSKKARTRSVALLKGIAAYLSSGAARITGEQIKEACLHYDAYDSPNHARYLKDMSSELSGSKSGGYTLTARGITTGTDLIKAALGIKAES